MYRVCWMFKSFTCTCRSVHVYSAFLNVLLFQLVTKISGTLVRILLDKLIFFFFFGISLEKIRIGIMHFPNA